MSLLRTIKCDIDNCDSQETETDYGKGWEGWAIIQGMSKNTKPTDRPITMEDMQLTLCPEHRLLVAQFIARVDEENKS